MSKQSIFRKITFVLFVLFISNTGFAQEDYVAQGLEEYNIGLYPQALESFGQAIEQNPNNLLAYLHRARTYRKVNLYLNAFDDINRAERLAQREPSIYALRGETYFLNGQYEEAVEQYSQAIKLSRHHDEYYAHRSLAQLMLNRYAQAEEDCRKALALNAESLIAKVALGKYYAAINDFQRAESLLLEVLRIDPQNNIYHRYLGDIYLKQRKLEDALEHYTTAANHRDRDHIAFYKMAHLQLLLGNEKEAKENLQHCLHINRQYKDIYVTRAIAHYNSGEKMHYTADLNKFLEQNNNAEDYAFVIEQILEYARHDGTILNEIEHLARRMVSSRPTFYHHMLYARLLEKTSRIRPAEQQVELAIAAGRKERVDMSEAYTLRRKLSTSNQDKEGPFIHITSPSRQELMASRGVIIVKNSETFTVIGNVQDESGVAELTVGGNPSKIGEKGAFAGTATLKAGSNEVLVRAVDKRGNVSEVSIIVDANATNNPAGDVLANKDIAIGQHFALLIATDNYIYWNGLNNPINDATTLAKNLEEDYGFICEILRNPTKDEILHKIREYAGKTYAPQDQLFIFLAGHGEFDEVFKEGYLVAKDTKLRGDETRSTYISYSNIRTYVNNIPCRHTLLLIDACFGGTFDPIVANADTRGNDGNISQDKKEWIKRKMRYVTRRFISSGGKEYVPDGRAGSHSPFVRELLGALRNFGGADGILTLEEIHQRLKGVQPLPRGGEFGDNEPGSDFLFIYRH